MPIYAYILFFGIGLTLASMGSDSTKSVVTCFLIAVFGGIALAAFEISDGSNYVAVITGLILTSPIGFGSLWLLMKIVDDVTGPIESLETKSFRSKGTISSAIDATKTGKVTLDVPIEEVSEFSATSNEYLSIGTRVIVDGLKRKRLVVKILPDTSK